MNNNANIDDSPDGLEPIHDTSGLEEIQKALAEIELLKNQDNHQQEEQEETKELHEESAAEEGDENAIENEELGEALESKKGKKELDKIWKIKKSRHKALAEKRALALENERLKEMLAQSLDSGTYHYGKTAFSELEKAKQDKKRAIEEGDVDALIESDINLNKALRTVNDLENWAQQAKQSNHENREQPRYPTSEQFNEVEQAIANDWLEDHPYLQPTSRNYDPDLAAKVSKYINYLDNNLANNGQANLYFSDPYFETIDNYINEIRESPTRAPKKLESAEHIGGVRTPYSGSSSSRQSSPRHMTLSADEKKISANLGISEEEYIKYKIQELKKNR